MTNGLDAISCPHPKLGVLGYVLQGKKHPGAQSTLRRWADLDIHSEAWKCWELVDLSLGIFKEGHVSGRMQISLEASGCEMVEVEYQTGRCRITYTTSSPMLLCDSVRSSQVLC